MRGPIHHLSVAVLALTTLGAAQNPPATSGTTVYDVLVRGVRIGSETVTTTATRGGWLVTSDGRQNAPIDLTLKKFEMTYQSDWQPDRLSIDATAHGRPFLLTTTFSATSAENNVFDDGRARVVTQPVSSHTVVLPTNVYGAYAALAARLASATAGARFPVYVAPQGEISVVVDRVTSRRLSTPLSTKTFRAFDLMFAQPSGPLAVEVWLDTDNRFARLGEPKSGLTVVREDIASVMAREEATHNAGDSNVFIPLLASNLAATVTSPGTGPAHYPAVVFAAGFGPADRDETIDGVPVVGQLAGALAGVGYLSVRYDRRGLGQSGGRADNATIDDYAYDLGVVVDWVRHRKDVDADRVAVVGYGEAGVVALAGAAHDSHIRALALVAAPGRPGRDVVLDEQARALSTLTASEAEKRAKIALEERIIRAVTTGAGWDDISPDIRHGADTPFFKSWLLFDPTPVMGSVSQPVLVLTGADDDAAPPADAARLEGLANSRRKAAGVRKVIVPGVTHTLVPADSSRAGVAAGASPAISPDVPREIAAWLSDVFARKK